MLHLSARNHEFHKHAFAFSQAEQEAAQKLATAETAKGLRDEVARLATELEAARAQAAATDSLVCASTDDQARNSAPCWPPASSPVSLQHACVQPATVSPSSQISVACAHDSLFTSKEETGRCSHNPQGIDAYLPLDFTDLQCSSYPNSNLALLEMGDLAHANDAGRTV